MRMTVDLDPDVADALAGLRKTHGRNIKSLINDIVRGGVADLDQEEKEEEERRKTRD